VIVAIYYQSKINIMIDAKYDLCHMSSECQMSFKSEILFFVFRN
jgi:hypothetical protein